MSNRQGVTYDADNLVNLTPGSLTYNGATYDVAASGSAAAAQATANTALAAAAAAQATANAALPKAGGTMTGDINMSGTQRVTNLASPAVSTDAATKGYVDTAVVGLLDLKGTIDCSGNPNYPAADKGDVYVVSVAGLIGGGAGIAVQAGDALVAIADNPGGTQAAVGTSWSILQANLIGALLAANNLSDVQNVATARNNLGLGTAATQNSTAFATAAQGTLASTAVQRAGDTMSGDLTLGSGAMLKLSGGTTAGQGNVQMGAAANAGWDTNILYVDANTRTNGMICSATPAASASNGPYVIMRGNTYAAIASQRANLYLAAGNPSTPNASEGSVYFFTGADVQRMKIDAAGAVTIAQTLTVSNDITGNSGASIKLTGGAASGKGNIQMGATASAVYDTNIVYVDSNARTMGMICSSTPASGAANGPYVVMRGNTYAAIANQRGALYFGAGNPATPVGSDGSISFATGSDVTRLSIGPTGAIAMPNATLKLGTSGTALSQVTVYTPTLTPAAIAAAGYNEQTFTVTGLATTDTVIVNGPAAAANSVLVHARVSAANTLALTWITNAATITPTSGTYRIVAIRS